MKDENSIKGIEELGQFFKEHITQDKYDVFIINSSKNGFQEEEIVLVEEFWLNKNIKYGIFLDKQQ